MTYQPPTRYDPFVLLTRVTGLDLPFQVRFGGDRSRVHLMWLRLGPIEQGDIVYGHVLAELGNRDVVVRDAVVWDHAVRGFVLSGVHEVDRLAEQLDVTAAIFGGIGGFFESAATIVMDLIAELLTPSFFVIGGIGTILVVFFLYYALLYMAAHWALWFVIGPSVVVTVVCFAVRDARRDRLRRAVLTAANDALRATLAPEWAP